ncbi:tight adherence protein B [Arthrobacter sp. SORGH_AS 212]|uniref:type II secretion system F family protein n=1 Tax=Pseudarthrobacter sp. SORGH_AS 212 TaxID=3041777 RepID=UPI00277ECC6A|nr:tight adherence protein B [Arthrobacter sp. SORGH_AS_0212]
MIVLLALALSLAVLLLLKPPRGAAARLRRAAGQPPARTSDLLGGSARRRFTPKGKRGSGKNATVGAPLTLLVQQLAALLKGGRTPARLWDELWTVYGTDGPQPSVGDAVAGPARGGLSEGSLALLAAARGAAARGTPVSAAIRRALPEVLPGGCREARIWSELAACFDIAEASGCPLADVLTRFAAQLEVESDADAARQTALAGPKATVTLLTWLPLMGLGLGMALGVDPLAMLLGTPLGLAALLGGAVLTVAGRLWSSRLVATAAGTGKL